MIVLPLSSLLGQTKSARSSNSSESGVGGGGGGGDDLAGSWLVYPSNGGDGGGDGGRGTSH